MKFRYLFAVGLTSLSLAAQADVVTVGSGSYSTTFPGTDSAGRNAYPAGTPFVSGKAANRPVPTNDWWSNELINNHGNNIFNYPAGLRPDDGGLTILNPVLGGAMPADSPITIGVSGLNALQTTVCDYSDWTVSINWGDKMTATMGEGMPFVYFEKTTDDAAVITISMGSAKVIDGNILVVSGSYNGAGYAVYAPAGSTWNLSGNTATSNLGGKNYWSAVMIQNSVGDVETIARDWAKYAFVFPGNTVADFRYDDANGQVYATYSVTPDVKEGSNDTFLMGLLPHHWANLYGNVNFIDKAYNTIRGELKMAATNSFTTALRFGGVLPTIPAAMDPSSGYSDAELIRLIDGVLDNTGLSDWTDSYNDGQLLNRVVQTARIAQSIGYEAGFQKGLDIVRNHLERWLTYSQGDIAFMFYYHEPWTAMLGYPAGHGQDSNINDHHFHWGYFIHAASFIEQNQPGWAQKFGGMVDLLVRDAASSDRNDSMFPYLRSFSPYAGHCWANGTASIGTGNDQESTSESMQFNCSLIHWGAVTGNKQLRDLGVCLYAIERSATEEYWFDVNNRRNYDKALMARIFTNDQDANNFWGAGIEGSYGIHVYPVHAGSFYLVNNPDYAQKLWNAMKSETGILNNEDNGNIWYDSWFQLVSMIDPQEALTLYNNCTHNGEKFGVSQAQTYQQLHAAMQLGVPRQDITANYPLASVFDNNGVKTYAVQNYGTEPITVTFSDGMTVTAKAGELITTTDGLREPTLSLTASKTTVNPGDNVTITLTVDEGDHTVKSTQILLNGTFVSAERTYEWTAGEAGDYVFTAVAVTDEDKTFNSKRSAVVTVEPIIDAAPAPEQSADVVKSIFSGHYETIVPGMTWEQWDSPAKFSVRDCSGDPAQQIASFQWFGIQLGSTAIDVNDMNMVHLDIYPMKDMSFQFYPISGGNDNVFVSQSVNANQWNSIDIPLNRFAGIDFSQLAQFKFAGGNGETFLVDNIYFYKTDADIPEPTPTVIPAAPAPEHDSAVVKSIYSGAYTSVVPNMFFADWGGGGSFSEIDCVEGENKDKAYCIDHFNWFGIQFGGNDDTFDASDMNMIHVDLYAESDFDINIYPISLGATTVDTDKKSIHLTANKWTSFDLSMSDFPNVDFANLGQFKFDNGNGHTIYLDNLYLWSDADQKRNAVLTLSVSATSCKPGETITFDLGIDEGDHEIITSVLKVNGELVSSLDHSTRSRATKSHSHEWTAPETVGEYTVIAEATSSENRTFTSSPVTVKVEAAEQGGEDPTPAESECEVTFTKVDGDDSPFKGDYKITFETVGNDVTVTAHFDGTYVGMPDFAYLWEDSNGFHEYTMTSLGNQTFTYTLKDVTAGTTLKFAVKIVASADVLPSGMAVTPYVSYVAGQTCGSTTGVGEISLSDISVYPNPASEIANVTVPGRCQIMVFSAAGLLVHESTIIEIGQIEVGGWPRGIYFVRFINESGDTNVVKLIKK